MLTKNELTSHNSVKYKGPIVQVKEIEKNPNNAEIINISRDDDEEKLKEKRKNNFCSLSYKGKKLNFQSNFEYRGAYSNFILTIF